jgi:hypothetical protein
VYFITVYCKQSIAHLKEKAVIKGWPASWAETIEMARYETSGRNSGGAGRATDMMMRRIRRSRSDLAQEGGGGV